MINIVVKDRHFGSVVIIIMTWLNGYVNDIWIDYVNIKLFIMAPMAKWYVYPWLGPKILQSWWYMMSWMIDSWKINNLINKRFDNWSNASRLVYR